MVRRGGSGLSNEVAEAVFDPESWTGPGSAEMVAALRVAFRPLARKHELAVDEVISVVWETAQDPWVLHRAESRAKGLLAVVEHRVRAAAEAERRLMAPSEALEPPPEARELREEISEVEAAIRLAYESPNGLSDVPELQRRHGRLHEALGQMAAPVRGGEHIELLADSTADEATSGDCELGALEVAVDALEAAGWSRHRGCQVVRTVAARGGSALKASSGTGAAHAADRLRRDIATQGLLGLRRKQWLSVVALVVGTRHGGAGVVERVAIHGEHADDVLAEDKVQNLARRATAKTAPPKSKSESESKETTVVSFPA